MNDRMRFPARLGGMRWSNLVQSVLSSGRDATIPTTGTKGSWWTLVRARARAALVAIVGLAATVWAAKFYDGVRPLRSWLFIEVATIWGYELFLTAACLSAGYALLDRVLGLKRIPALEKVALSLALGLVCFVIGMYVGGYARLYGPLFAILLPLVMTTAGLPVVVPVFARWRKTRVKGRGFGVISVAAWVFGILALGMIYLGVFSPDAVNYDAAWNHLVIAQDYAREGRIVPFLADWVKNVPHLGSIVNTWAFLVPGFDEPALRWMMALHTEFTVLLWTLVGVAAGARYVAHRNRLPGAWGAMFLFPGLFVTDGNLGAAADHFLAVFIVPVFLAVGRCIARFDTRHAVLAGLLAGGALLTKFQALFALIPLGLALAVGAGVHAVAHIRGKPEAPAPRRLLGVLGAGLGAFLLVVSFHFLKNAVFYKNPFYPLAQKWFPSWPSFPGAAEQFDYLFADWRWLAPTDPWLKLKDAIVMPFSFSFEAHYSFVGNAPVFGSLFTLCLPILPFLRKARRLWLGAAIALGTLAVWAATFRTDRYMQLAVPLFAVVMSGVLVRGWELGTLARVGVTALVGLQVVWGADYWFHGTDRINSAVSLIRSGMDGRAAERFKTYRRDHVDLGKSLPENALVLLHRQHVMLGIDRTILTDLIGLQGLIDQRPFKTAREPWQRLREIGVTHVVWSAATDAMTLQEAAVFEAFAAYHAPTTRSFGSLRVSPLAPSPPPNRPPLTVLILSLPGYGDGLYAVDALKTEYDVSPDLRVFPAPAEPVTPSTDLAALVQRADVVFVGRGRALPSAPGASELVLLRSPPRDFSIYGHPRKMVSGEKR